MAIMYDRPTSISRGSSRSAVSAAAYRSASKMTLSFSNMSADVREKLAASYTEKYHLVSEMTGEVIGLVWDYSSKGDEIISGIMAPETAPEWVFDRELLWQSVENAGKRVDARLAREHTIALPIELTKEQNEELVKDFVSNTFVARGMVADYNIHFDNPENPHVHIMTTTRDLETDPEGKARWGKVNVSWDNLAVLKAIRREQATVINHHLEMHGHSARVSHLSHAERGLDIIPGVHEGPARWIKSAELKQQNHSILFENASKIITDPTIVIDKLSIDKPVFTSADIEKELHKALIMGINPNDISEQGAFEIWSQNELLSMYNTVIASNKLTLVNPCDLKGRMLFAKAERIELEHRFEENVRELADKTTHSIDIGEEDIAEVSPGKQFSKAQKQAIIDVLKGSDISVLEGWPGSGKTTVMRQIVRQYKLAGYNVIGTAPTNKAAEELSVKVGIEAVNTTKLRQQWQKEKTGNRGNLNLTADYYKQEAYQEGKVILPEKTILIIDEASMVDLPSLDYFTNEIKACGGKVIELGDNNQNPAIGYKGGFSKAGDIAGRTVLMENNRHQNPDEYIRNMHIEATRSMGRYDIAKALSIYEALNMIRVFDTEDKKQEAIAADYVSAVIKASREHGDSQALSNSAISAYTNAEVDNLNRVVRTGLKNAGIIKGEARLFRSGSGIKEGEGEGEEKRESKATMVELCLGDQVIFKSNKPEFEGYGGVRNNELGIITQLGEVDKTGVGEFEVKIGDGNKGFRLVKIKTGEDILPVSFKHGYALTGYAVQGADIDRFFYSAGSHSGYEAFVVGASRHKDNCLIYIAKETMEDEVYKTKDLDSAKVKEEFAAYAYKYEQGTEMLGKIQWDQVDVPLWKVGLRLLISKRTNLNFAKDYAYGDHDYQKIIAYQESIETSRRKLNKLQEDLVKWRKDTETPLVDKDKQIASDSKEAEAIIKATAHISLVAMELQKHFAIKDGEIIIDPISIEKAASDYKLLKINEGDKFKSAKDITNRINEHVATLKLGAGSGENKEQLNWSDLSELDRDLVIRTVLSKKELSWLTKTVKAIGRYEKRISLQSSKVASIHIAISKEADNSNKLLSGNIGAMREYLDSREQVLQAQKEIETVDLYLKRPITGKQLAKEAFDNFGLKIAKLNINAQDILRSETKFSANHFRSNEQLIKQLKQEKDNSESAKQLSQLFDTGLQIDRHLSELSKQDNVIGENDSYLLASRILQVSKSAILKGKYEEISERVEELNEARAERQEKAKVITDHYNGFVCDDLMEKAKLIKNSFIEQEEAIKEEWDAVQRKKITKDLGAGFGHNFSEEYYNMVVLAKKSQLALVLKDNLCPIATEATKAKLTSLKEQRQLLEPELEIIAKQIEDSRLGTEDYHGDSNKVSMGKLISQVNVSYETIRKHAGLEEVKHYFASNDNDKTIINNPHFGRIMDVVELANSKNSTIDQENVTKVIAAHHEFFEELVNTRKVLTSKELLKLEASKEHADMVSGLSRIEKYKSEELPHFLSRIYKDKPEDIKAKLDKMLDETEHPVSLARAIGESPEMLGELKSTGLWASLTKGEEVRGIKANLDNLGTGLIKYVKEEEMRLKLQEDLNGGVLVSRIKELELEIATLKSQLPTKEEQQLLDDIGHLKDSIHFDVKTAGADLTDVFKGDNANDILLDFAALKGEAEIRNAKAVKAKDIFVQDKDNEQKQELASIRPTEEIRPNSYKGKDQEKETLARVKNPDLNFKTVKSALTASHIESIFRSYASSINPDGKIVKKGSNITCGSLNMNLTNGLWHRFSDGSKGDVFKFVEQATGCQKKDALLIVAKAVGITAEMNSQIEGKLRRVELINNEVENRQVRDSFTVYETIPTHAPRLNIDTHLKWLTKGNKIDNIWTYRNIKGELIGGVIRMIDKKTGDKQVKPVAYGHNGSTGEDQWKLKGFLSQGYKPIYGAEKLLRENKPVLIVEGEKTADKAQELLPDYTVISWLGGAHGTAKVNWQQLEGRSVTIWPDNDMAGQIAAKSILDEINKANGFSGYTSIVDTESLNLPHKWDLADKLPEHLSLEGIKEAISTCQNKDKKIADYIEEATKLSSQQEQKIFWQQSSIGISRSKESIVYRASLNNEIHERIGSKEIAEYMDYAITRGKDGSAHQFLKFTDNLYKEMVSSSTFNYLEKHKGSEHAHELKTLLLDKNKGCEYQTGSEQIIKEVQNIYSKATDSFGLSSLTNLSLYIKNNKQLAEKDPAKAELHQILMKDFCVLHLEQLGVRDLSDSHKAALSEDLYRIISSYNLDYKGNDRTLKDSDRAKIASMAHDSINTPDWWQGLVKDQLKLARSNKVEILTTSQQRLKSIHDQLIAVMEESGIKGNSVLSRAEGHMLEYMQANNHGLKDAELASQLVKRAAFEVQELANWKHYVNFKAITYGDLKRLNQANGKLEQEIITEKLVMAHGYLKSRQSINGLNDDEITKKTEELVYNHHKEEVNKLIRDEASISKLHQENPLAAEYLAQSIVNFKHNYGESLLTEERTKIMEEVALQQADLHELVDSKMQIIDNKILDGKHKSLSGDILDNNLLEADREMTAKSITTQLGHDLTHDMLARSNIKHEELHDHHEFYNTNRQESHNYSHIEHDYQHEITSTIQRTRSMQHEYHQQIEQEHEKEININNNINISY